MDIFKENEVVSKFDSLEQAILLFDIQNKHVADLNGHDCKIIANLLKELKAYKTCNEGKFIHYKEECAYNKAIDDYNKELKEYLRRFTVHYVSDKDFDYIAKQLKGGVSNDD